MERVSRSCGEHLLSQLTPENWLGVRTIPGIANDVVLVDELDRYIQEQVLLLSNINLFSNYTTKYSHSLQDIISK